MNQQSPPPPPEPNWTERQLARAAKPEPMLERDYGHMMRVHDEPVSVTDPLTGQKFIETLSLDAANYLGALRAIPAPRLAREAAGVTSQQVAAWRRKPGFAALEREAAQDAADALLASCYNRAVHGVLKPIFQLGRLVGYERVFSDKLAEVLLKAMLPKMFRTAAPEPQKPQPITLFTPEQIGDVVRRLSPTGSPAQ